MRAHGDRWGIDHGRGRARRLLLQGPRLLRLLRGGRRLADTAAHLVDDGLVHVPDAWVDTARRDPKDGRMGVIGYEINFNRTFTFNRYIPPRPLDEIEADTQAIKRTTSSGGWRR